MAALSLQIAAAALVGTGAPAAAGASPWQPFIEEAAARFALPPAWIAQVMTAESGGQTTLRGRPITSAKGAMGLMQLMPETWAAMRARLQLGADPHAPRDNILAGAFYLRLMYERFGYPGLFAAYNAGPGRYADHLATGRALPAETRRYLDTLAPDDHPDAADRVPRSLLFLIGADRRDGGSGPDRKAEPGVFFRLRTAVGGALAQRRGTRGR